MANTSVEKILSKKMHRSLYDSLCSVRHFKKLIEADEAGKINYGPPIKDIAEFVEKAYENAPSAKNGKPWLEHILVCCIMSPVPALSNMSASEQERALGKQKRMLVDNFLHDIIEDFKITKMTYEKLKRFGIPERSIESTRTITREEYESYFEDYIQGKVLKDGEASMKKDKDQTQNLTNRRYRGLPKEIQDKLADKYKPTYSLLRSKAEEEMKNPEWENWFYPRYVMKLRVQAEKNLIENLNSR